MSFGNMNNFIYIIFPILITILLITGFLKKEKVLEYLKLNSKKVFRQLKIFFISLGSIFIFIALLSPQKDIKTEIERKGVDLYVLMDTSYSMLGKDVFPNRLEKSKLLLKNIVKSLKGDRIGIIPFSNVAYIQLPLTEDYSIVDNYIDVIDENLISGGGTNLLKAFEVANNSFENSKSKIKVVLLISDGGDRDNNVMSYIKDNNIIVYTVGVGTLQGSTIPTENGFIKDRKGNPVITQLNSEFLKEMAKESGGKYFEINNLTKLDFDFEKESKNLERNQIGKVEVKVLENYFQIPLGIGIILLVIGYLMSGVVIDEKK